MIVIACDVLHTVSIRLLNSLFSGSVCRNLMSFTPVWITTAPMLSSSFRIAETSRTRAPGKQRVCTLPLVRLARTCRTMESPMITALRSLPWRGTKRFRVEISKAGGGRGEEVLARGLAHVFCCWYTPFSEKGGSLRAGKCKTGQSHGLKMSETVSSSVQSYMLKPQSD